MKVKWTTLVDDLQGSIDKKHYARHIPGNGKEAAVCLKPELSKKTKEKKAAHPEDGRRRLLLAAIVAGIAFLVGLEQLLPGGVTAIGAGPLPSLECEEEDEQDDEKDANDEHDDIDGIHEDHPARPTRPPMMPRTVAMI